MHMRELHDPVLSQPDWQSLVEAQRDYKGLFIKYVMPLLTNFMPSLPPLSQAATNLRPLP